MPGVLELDMLTMQFDAGAFIATPDLQKSGWCALEVAEQRFAFVAQNGATLRIPAGESAVIGNTSTPGNPRVELLPTGASLWRRQPLPVVRTRQ